MRSLLLAPLILLTTTGSRSQPALSGELIRFTYSGPADSSVALVGDFNGWARTDNPCVKNERGIWMTSRHIDPGLYQYRFMIDGKYSVVDPGNPASVDNFDRSARNSVFVVTKEGAVQMTDHFEPPVNTNDLYEPRPGLKPLYLNVIWHQHQPLYVNPAIDQLTGPWVRTHATKDYYDMAATLRKYPSVHCTINLTSSLLLQLQHYYVDRLGPFIDVGAGTMRVDEFFARWAGKTDPWIDLALKPTEEFTQEDKNLMYRNIWNAFGISEVMIGRFPEYLRLKQKLDVDQPPGYDLLTVDEMREAKFWFYLAHFDPDFLRGPVVLEDGSVCDLSDLIREEDNETFMLRRKPGEGDCRRMVIESFKVMKNIIPVHRAMMYRPGEEGGQIEVITTPYYHPILPLIYDSDLARICQPLDALPARYSFPEDARLQVSRAVEFYRELFGAPPVGMWPGEGAVAQPVLGLFSAEGIRWTASDAKVLSRSSPENMPNTSPYLFPATSSGQDDAGMVLVFRDTELSDRIGFRYQTYDPEAAAEDFVASLLQRLPRREDDDVLLTVILDGENAWEWYRKDMDGKRFQNALYRKLSKLHELGLVVTVTVPEYIEGNQERNVPPHPAESLPRMDWLYPGSWINASYDTWIGEPEENDAWEALLTARNDLAQYGPPYPLATGEGAADARARYADLAWEAMFAAEGSDWFWWYGNDQKSPGGDAPFDEGFRTHLRNIYHFSKLAGYSLPRREFPPLLRTDQQTAPGQGTMAQSTGQESVVFTCDARNQVVQTEIFIVGSLMQLGGWTPNTVQMYDDGTHGDIHAGDGIWTLELAVPSGEEISYKYTNSGKPGEWAPGEEFPGRNRSLFVPGGTDRPFVVNDVFGRTVEQ